jgi:hypothetical protein
VPSGTSGSDVGAITSVTSASVSPCADEPPATSGASATSLAASAASSSVDDGDTISDGEDVTAAVVVPVRSSAVPSPAADASPVGAPDASPVGRAPAAALSAETSSSNCLMRAFCASSLSMSARTFDQRSLMAPMTTARMERLSMLADGAARVAGVGIRVAVSSGMNAQVAASLRPAVS